MLLPKTSHVHQNVCKLKQMFKVSRHPNSVCFCPSIFVFFKEREKEREVWITEWREQMSINVLAKMQSSFWRHPGKHKTQSICNRWAIHTEHTFKTFSFSAFFQHYGGSSTIPLRALFSQWCNVKVGVLKMEVCGRSALHSHNLHVHKKWP